MSNHSDQFYDPEKHKREPDEMAMKEVRDELRLARVRIVLAQAFVDMLRFAYDALLHHGIDHRQLPEYKDTTLMDRVEKEPLALGQGSYVEWMRRVRHGITAAIRRKGFKKV